MCKPWGEILLLVQHKQCYTTTNKNTQFMAGMFFCHAIYTHCAILESAHDEDLSAVTPCFEYSTITMLTSHVLAPTPNILYISTE